MPDSGDVSIVPSEDVPRACTLCGATVDFEVRPWRGVTAAPGQPQLWYAVCRRCLLDDVRRGVAAQVAHWQGVADDLTGGPFANPILAAEQVRLVARSLGELLAREGVEPDDVTATFIARFTA